MSTTTVQRVALSEQAAAALAEYADFEIYMLIDEGRPQDSETIRRVGGRLVHLADLADAAGAGEVEISEALLHELPEMRTRAADSEREAATARRRMATYVTTGRCGPMDENYLAEHPEVDASAYRAETFAGWGDEAARDEQKAQGVRRLIAEVTV